MAVSVDLPRDALVALCQRWGIGELSFFGSILRADFGPASDVDVMIEFLPGRTPGLAAMRLQEELEELLGRPVDVLTRTGIMHSGNVRLRREILETAELYYAAAA